MSLLLVKRRIILKKQFLFLLVLGLSIAGANLPALGSAGDAQGVDNTPVVSAAASADSSIPLSVLETDGAKNTLPGNAEYDFGAYLLKALKHNIQHDFILRNISDAPVVIDRVQAMCECTTVTVMGGFPNTVIPGGQVTIRASLDPKRLVTGHIDKPVSIFVAGQPQAVLTLHIAGMLNSAETFEPRSLMFENVALGQSPTASFTVTLDKEIYKNNAPDPVCSGPGFEVIRDSKAAIDPLPGKIVQKYTVKVSPKGYVGLRQAFISMTGEEGTSDPGVFVTVNVTGDIAASQPSVWFKYLRPKTTNLWETTIVAANKSVLKGLKVSTTSRNLKAAISYADTDAVKMTAPNPSGSAKQPDEFPVDANGKYYVTLKAVVTPDKPGLFQSHIYVAAKSGQVLIIPVSGWVIR